MTGAGQKTPALFWVNITGLLEPIVLNPSMSSFNDSFLQLYKSQGHLDFDIMHAIIKTRLSTPHALKHHYKLQANVF